MIDFSNAKYLKLHAVDNNDGLLMVEELLVPGEVVERSFKTVRDMVVFTDKRIIAINVQGFTGKKRDFSTLPYAKVQAFSVETAGTIDLDAELELWFSGLGKVRFEFTGRTDIRRIGQLIASKIM